MNSNKNNQNHNITVGLDIGSSKITCASGKIIPNKKYVKLLGISSISSRGINKGIITHRDKLIEVLESVISNTERMASIKVTNTLLSITGEHIKSLNTQAAIPLNRINGTSGKIHERPIDNNDIFQVLDLAQAVSLPVDRDILHTLPQEYLVDTLDEIKNPIGMTGRRLEGRVHLVTAANTAMLNLINSVEELGITVDGLVFQPLASSLSTLQHDEMELGVTLVEIGSSTTDIAVYYAGAVRHSAIIPLGSSSITNDIAVMLQVSIKEAEEIKRKYGSAKSEMSSSELEINLDSSKSKIKRSVSEKEVARYIEARIQEILHLVIREISRADIKNSLTYGIVVTGGGAELKNIVSLAENLLGIKVRKGSPIRIEGIEGIADETHYTTIMGLLLWPLYSNDHTRTQNPINGNLKIIYEKIRHTIEQLF